MVVVVEVDVEDVCCCDGGELFVGCDDGFGKVGCGKNIVFDDEG